MQLTEDQKSTISKWIQEGRSLADVQRSLLEEFKISMTYMDVRFLVDDLDIAMVEAEEENEASDSESAKPVEEAEIVDEGGHGQVRVDVDALMRPGSLVSGTVQFSDGQSLAWQLGATGQLGLIPDESNPEYRPSASDLEEFQTQLQDVLQKKGF